MIDFPLTHEQQAAAQSSAESTLVLAGAGTGKTRTLLGRVLELVLHRHVPARQILLLAFARQAALEMRERLESLSKHASQLRQVEVRTFHSLGLNLQKNSNSKTLRLSELTEDTRFEQFVRAQICARCWSNPRFKEAYFKWVTLSAALLQLSQQQFGDAFPTLRGGYADSQAKLLLDNLLYELNIHAVPGVLLADPKDKIRMLHRRDRLTYYRCSFYLPLHKVAIFLSGLEPGFSGSEHRQALRSDGGEKFFDPNRVGWFFRKSPQTPSDQQSHKLPETLIFMDDRGCQHEVKCLHLKERSDQISTLESFRQTLHMYRGHSTRLRLGKGVCSVNSQSHIIAGYIRLYCQRSLSSSSKKLLGKYAPILAPVLLPLLRSYRSHLRRHKEIDFNTMLAGASRYVSERRVSCPWRHVLVDECQDLSEPQYRLLNAIRSRHDRCDIFCVGDDWQSIYRFAGSDIRYVTDFESNFGKCEIYKLTLTHRFDLGMCQLSSDFILQNPSQSRKFLTAKEGRRRPITILKNSISVAAVLADIVRDNVDLCRAGDQAPSQASVLILARFNHQLPGPLELRRLRRQFPCLKIQVNTVHAVKGNEADYVIVTDCDRDEFGFPSEKHSDAITEMLLPAAELFAHAEERRLFYVALTRTRRQCYLLYDEMQPSVFIRELLKKRKAIRTRLQKDGTRAVYSRLGEGVMWIANNSKRLTQDLVGRTEK